MLEMKPYRILLRHPGLVQAARIEHIYAIFSLDLEFNYFLFALIRGQ